MCSLEIEHPGCAENQALANHWCSAKHVLLHALVKYTIQLALQNTLSYTRFNRVVWALYRDSVSLTPLIQVFWGRPLALWPLNLVLYTRWAGCWIKYKTDSSNSILLTPILTLSAKENKMLEPATLCMQLDGCIPSEAVRHTCICITVSLFGWSQVILFFFFFFFVFPSYISGVHRFWVRFLRMWPFFNPTIKVVTFCLHGWCVLRVFLLPAFTRLGHERQDLLSPCDECMCAQTSPRFILSSEGVFGGMEFEPMLTPREESPLPENVPRGGSNPWHCGQRAQALPTELFRPKSSIDL